MQQFYLAEIVLIYCSTFFTFAEPLQGYDIVPAKPNEFPFIASIGRKIPSIPSGRKHICTGTLITRKHVLTAEHCFTNKRPGNVDVIIDVVNWKTAGTRYEVHSWVTYRNWASFYNKSITFAETDIAVVKLISRVSLNVVTPVTYTTLNNVQLYRTSAIIAGWGVTNEGVKSDVLLKAKVKIITKEDCEQRIRLMTNEMRNVHESLLCTAGDPYTLLSQGDSGGPLLDEHNVLLGINCLRCSNRNWGNFSDAFMNKYKVNLHPSINFYKEFIENVSSIN